jgi:hypothetical protein
MEAGDGSETAFTTAVDGLRQLLRWLSGQLCEHRVAAVRAVAAAGRAAALAHTRSQEAVALAATVK